VVLILEDVHWSDPSSLELVLLLLNQIHTIKILMLLTLRTDFRLPWFLYPYLTQLPLDRLTTSEVQTMIERVSGAKRLPPVVLKQVVEKTDGVPLFIEELTKAVIESDALIETRNDYQLRSPVARIDIPISLNATLMARLDGLGSAKHVAQCGSVIGRDFSHELITVTTGISARDLEHGLARLVEANLLFQRGVSPRAQYSFKHAMLQEIAYQSLLRVDRVKYHRRIAEALIARHADIGETPPELVAHHYSAARLSIEAAHYWRRAGEQALLRSANVEALVHINRGLGELATCPRSALRIKEEVLLLISLGVALTASKGYAAREVEQTYAQASQLCRELDDPSQQFPVLRELQSFYVVRGPLRTSCGMAEQLRQIADQTGDPLQAIEAHRRLGWCLFCMGRIDAGRTYLERALQTYDSAKSSQHIAIYGSDPGIIGHVNLAWLEWFAGRPDKAVTHSKRAIALAQELSFGLGTAYALGMSAALYQCLGDPETTATLATETIELAQQHGFPYWIAWETSLLGWARTAQGQVETGISMMRKGLADYRATGAELFTPYLLGLLAQAHSGAERFDDALAFSEEALTSGERSGVHFFDAEVLRLKGGCLLRDKYQVTGAQACFQQAVAIARDQGARMLELRAAIALAMLRQSAGEGGAASRLLSEAVASFSSIDKTPDLEQARRLLQEWMAEQRG